MMHGFLSCPTPSSFSSNPQMLTNITWIMKWFWKVSLVDPSRLQGKWMNLKYKLYFFSRFSFVFARKWKLEMGRNSYFFMDETHNDTLWMKNSDIYSCTFYSFFLAKRPVSI
jgi:hypothetical protein